MGTTATELIRPSIYVPCLAAYNNSILHGAWIDAAQDAGAISDEIARMLRASPIKDAEEWAIHGYKGFESVQIGEYESIERVVEIAGFVAEHEELGAELIAHFGGDLNKARQALEESYLGLFDSVADYMEHTAGESMNIPEPLRYYIDWEAMARDAEMSGDLFAIEVSRDVVHVFAGG